MAIILVHYYTGKLLVRAVQALKTDLMRAGLTADIVVVDNGSSQWDRSLMAELPIRRIDPGKNLGYAGGVNLGVKNTIADIFFIMNPDVEVLPGCLSNLIAALENDRIAAVGPRFFWDRGKTFFLPPTEERTRSMEIARILARGNDRWANYARKRWRNHTRRYWSTKTPVRSYTLSGALLGIRKDAWNSVGPFDETYMLYFEETDWLLRLQRKRLRALFVPNAEAIHFYNKSATKVGSSTTTKWFRESHSRFKSHYYGAWFSTLTDYLTRRQKPKDSRSPDRTNNFGVLDLSFLNGSVALPLWIELSVSGEGFPAAATVVENPCGNEWRLPNDLWQNIDCGTYFLRVVDASGNELSCESFEKTN